MKLGDTVMFRRHPGAHEEVGRLVGRAFGRASYDVATTDHEIVLGLASVRPAGALPGECPPDPLPAEHAPAPLTTHDEGGAGALIPFHGFVR